MEGRPKGENKTPQFHDNRLGAGVNKLWLQSSLDCSETAQMTGFKTHSWKKKLKKYLNRGAWYRTGGLLQTSQAQGSNRARSSADDGARKGAGIHERYKWAQTIPQLDLEKKRLTTERPSDAGWCGFRARGIGGGARWKFRKASRSGAICVKA